MDDLIRRQDVIDAIEDDARYGLHSCFACWADAQEFKESIKKIDPAQQWIPCSERLPEKDGRYWAWCEIFVVPDHVDDPCSYYGSREASYLNDHWYGDDIGKVVAWMPLPEPYKESEE